MSHAPLPPLIKDVFMQRLHLHNIKRFFSVNLADVQFFCWQKHLFYVNTAHYFALIAQCAKMQAWLPPQVVYLWHFIPLFLLFFAKNTAQWYPALSAPCLR